MTEQEYRRLYYEVYHLPTQIANARAKLARLEDRARKYGMRELLANPDAASDAFELEAVRALAANRECDQ
jgi:hypothetical protein